MAEPIGLDPHRPEALRIAQSLAMDGHSAELVWSLTEKGVRCILLKGPSLAWLYGGARTYTDTDLLISETNISSAEGVLEEAGFRQVHLLSLPYDRPWHALTWARADGWTVDLHRTLIGIGVSAEQVWTILSEKTATQVIGGRRIEVLSDPAMALHVALHAAQHGIRVGRPLEDLTRALVKIPFDAWRGAVVMAARLDATDAFAAGLRLTRQGEILASDLGLPPNASVHVALRSSTAPPLSLGFDWLATIDGNVARIKFLRHKLLPSKSFMWDWSPLARRGRMGLWMAYFARPFWIAARLIPAFRAWRRATKQVPSASHSDRPSESV